MKWLSDPTRRFIERPLFTESEIQERVNGVASEYFDLTAPPIPLSDNMLDLIVDSLTDHYDPESQLEAHLGANVEGVTIFNPGKKARVKISSTLLDNKYFRRRRMTIAHEIGHVLLHSELYTENRNLDLFADSTLRGNVYCKAETMLPGIDWMEWQASYAAGCLLMPSDSVRQVIERLRGERINSALYLGDDETNSVINHVGSSFEVSFEAAKVRLMQLRFIEEACIQRLPLY